MGRLAQVSTVLKNLLSSVRPRFAWNAGKNKLIINHLGRLFVTSDAATIIREIEVIHPAAKLLVGASQAQEAEHGDNTNFVLIFAGELLKRAVNLLVMGMHPSEVVLGFEMASEKAREELESALTFIACVPAGSDVPAPVPGSRRPVPYGHRAAAGARRALPRPLANPRWLPPCSDLPFRALGSVAAAAAGPGDAGQVDCALDRVKAARVGDVPLDPRRRGVARRHAAQRRRLQRRLRPGRQDSRWRAQPLARRPRHGLWPRAGRCRQEGLQDEGRRLHVRTRHLADRDQGHRPSQERRRDDGLHEGRREADGERALPRRDRLRQQLR